VRRSGQRLNRAADSLETGVQDICAGIEMKAKDAHIRIFEPKLDRAQEDG
jgi:hypothetical protein